MTAGRSLKKWGEPRYARQGSSFRASPIGVAPGIAPPGIALSAVVWVAAALFMSVDPAAAQLRYERDYPMIPYEDGALSGPVAGFIERLASGEARLERDDTHGYLRSLLELLDIPISSQVLVFSDTSLQTGLISAAAPRAIYFNDEVYVAWVQETDMLEIASMDPALGPVFHTLPQPDPGAAPPMPGQSSAPPLERQTFMCLECHDEFGLTGGGVPRFLIGSGPTDGRGGSAVHGGWAPTTDRTPIRRRWGGWYVTGTHGTQRHLGNLLIRSAEQARAPDLDAGANRETLEGLVDTAPYLSPHSDIVALLVLEHQLNVQNTMTRASWDVRAVLGEQTQTPLAELPFELRQRVFELAEPLVEALFFVGEAPLEAPFAGTSGFREEFEARGPADAQGRSLREFDLRNRMFRYPLSYLVYSPAFQALPAPLLDAVFLRIEAILSSDGPTPGYDHLSPGDRSAIREILTSTHLRHTG